MTRRDCHTVIGPDGIPAVQDKPPRADLLRYPHLRNQVTVLVRRTHDVDVARALAEQRWLDHLIRQAAIQGARCAILSPPALEHHRVGWWLTWINVSPRYVLPRRGALDEKNRPVVWCEDPLAAHAPGAGVEFRPEAAPRTPGADQRSEATS